MGTQHFRILYLNPGISDLLHEKLLGLTTFSPEYPQKQF